MQCERESAMYSLWVREAGTGRRLRDRGGREIVVISHGELNDSAGPDFLNAVLLIDGRLCVGPVEMHRHEREWFAHGHERDPAYRGVVLHVIEADGATPLLSLPTVFASELRSYKEVDPLEDVRGASAPKSDLQHCASDRRRDSRRDAAVTIAAPGSREGARSLGTRPQDGASDARHEPMVTRELLVECAWARLLRRATEVMRTDDARDIGERMRDAYLRRVFDALGYSANRQPMRAVIRGFLATPVAERPHSFEGVATSLFTLGRCDPAAARLHGSLFMSESRLDPIVEAIAAARGHDGATAATSTGLATDHLSSHATSLHKRQARGCKSEETRGVGVGEPTWNRATRPANLPERRLWAGAHIVVGVEEHSHLERTLARITAGAPWNRIVQDLVVRLGPESFVGQDRAGELLMNALLPVGLADGVLRGSSIQIERICHLYRTAAPQTGNRTIRRFEARYLDGRVLKSGFWQQGAIELYQRYMASDRSMLSFVADSSCEGYHTVYRSG